ncbi:MAG: L7Ae/L30e/S12e/Gadd45 family ribosomal protein [Anaerovoracaceae bacterium]
MQKKKKIDSYLGFAKKSGNLAAGTGICRILADRGRLRLLIAAEDCAAGSREKMERLAEARDIPFRVYGCSDHLSRMTGTSGRMVFGITDENFAAMIIREIDTERMSDKEAFE